MQPVGRVGRLPELHCKVSYDMLRAWHPTFNHGFVGNALVFSWVEGHPAAVFWRPRWTTALELLLS